MPWRIGALGVVFGDIGTSPLYAFREAFEHQSLTVNETNALGIASVAFWALIVIISIKYIALVMRADNHGEGGILALTALGDAEDPHRRRTAGLVMLGVFGTALLYGDGLITPAISVLSAVEGFEVASSAFDSYVIPLACVILLCLFVVQRRGTGGIGKVFGPIMVVWFVTLGLLGLNQIRAGAVGPACGEPVVHRRVLPGRARQGVPVARQHLPGRHRRRGAVRRHGSLRPQADRRSSGTRWCCPAWC